MDQLDTGKGLSAADMKQELGIAVAMLDKASVAATPLRDYRYESKCFVLRCDNKNKTIFMLAYEIRFSRGSEERQAAFLPRLLDPGFPGVFSKPSSLSITLLTKRSAQEGRGYVVLKVVFAGFCRFWTTQLQTLLEKSPFYFYAEYVLIAIILELRSTFSDRRV